MTDEERAQYGGAQSQQAVQQSVASSGLSSGPPQQSQVGQLAAPQGTSLASLAQAAAPAQQASGLAAGTPQQGQLGAAQQASGLAAGLPQQGQLGAASNSNSLQAANSGPLQQMAPQQASQGLAAGQMPAQVGQFPAQPQRQAWGQQLGMAGASGQPPRMQGPTLQQRFLAGGGGFGQPQAHLGNNPMAQFPGWGGAMLAGAFRNPSQVQMGRRF